MKAKGLPHLRALVYSFILSSFFFALLLLGWRKTPFELPGSLLRGSLIDFLLAVVFLLFVFACFFVAIYFTITRLKSVLIKITPYNPLKKLSLTLDKKSILLCWLIIFLCWTPWLFLAFPADIHYDTLNQLWQYSTPAPTYYLELNSYLDANFHDHHPVFDTLLFGLFLEFGNLIGSQTMGIFVYALLQSLLTSGALAFSCCYLSKLGVPKVFRLLILAFVALFPPFAQFSATMSKDSLFAALFILYVLCIIEVFLTKGSVCKNKKFLVFFIVVTALCILTKKTGVYVMGISGIVLMLAYRENWKELLLSFSLPLILCSVLMPTFLYPILDVEPGGKQETFSALFQQTAAYFINHTEDVTDEERAIVARVLEPDRFEELFRADLVDPIKTTYNPEANSSDLLEYLGVWVVQGSRQPLTYFEATLDVNVGFIAPIQVIEHYGYCVKDEQFNTFYEKVGDAGITIERPAVIDNLSTKVQSAYYGVINNSPLLIFLFSNALWAFWLPILCIVLAFYNCKKYLIVFVPIILTILILVISPTVLSRYILPLLYTLPLVLGLMIHSFMSQTKLSESEFCNPSTSLNDGKALKNKNNPTQT